MPETAVHEDSSSSAWKDNIGPSRKVSTVQAESVPEPVDQASQGDLRIRILASDTPHIVTAPFLTNLIHRGLTRLSTLPLTRGWEALHDSACSPRQN